jgi:hypothetical protein
MYVCLSSLDISVVVFEENIGPIIKCNSPHKGRTSGDKTVLCDMCGDATVVVVLCDMCGNATVVVVLCDMFGDATVVVKGKEDTFFLT